jgi:hypothetical protein
MKWENDEIETAVTLNKNGKRFDEIASVLNRNKRSVEIRLGKLGCKENKMDYFETLTCLECGKEFIGFKRDNRKFCSQSCSAKFNNKIYPKRRTKNNSKNCVNCEKPLNRLQHKYCSSKCFGEYKRQSIFQKIEEGDKSLPGENYKNYLINKFGAKCMKCDWNEINPTTGLVPIQLEHKDGNSENHNLENLELLCPNCHSLTPTYGALNKGHGRTKRREERNKIK